jgi:PAS domain S-box-containing protein
LHAANAALRESEERFRASFEQSPVPMHTLTPDGVITSVSHSWLALLGYTQHEVIGRHIAEFAAPGSPTWVKADRDALQAEGEVRELERSLVRADGTAVETLVSARIERRTDPPMTVSVVIDITARRRAEAALRASEDRLRQAQKMEAVGQLTGGIAHDFNNMLQGIAGSLEIMERRIDQGRPADAVRYVDMARQSVTRAAGLTHRMLAFARRQALNPQPVEPDTLVRGIVELIQRTVGPGVVLDMHLRDGVWAALCDANQLESSLLNLAINARDAMPDGGTLTIATADRHLASADLTDHDDIAPGDYVEMSVADTGSGMTPEVIARAFEPFFTTKAIGQGSGLGLSQVYGFVSQSGGFMRLESTPGLGTTVRLYLPRHSGPAPAQAAADGADLAAPPPRPGTVADARVLVVDDETAVREQIAAVLQDLGCTVLEAADGLVGLSLLRSEAAIDLLVTDIGLPGLNGRQLADAARDLRPGLPVLMITGYAGAALEDMRLPAGMAVIVKPFALGALGAQVGALLGASLVR